MVVRNAWRESDHDCGCKVTVNLKTVHAGESETMSHVKVKDGAIVEAKVRW